MEYLVIEHPSARLTAVGALLLPPLVDAFATTVMDEHIKNNFKFLKSEKLSENERIQMRNVLRSVMAENPMQESAGLTRYETALSYFNTSTLRPVSFAFVFVMVVGIGTSYAAETALPGDPLYAIKVGVTEPIQGVLNVSPVAKAEWDTELLSRRLEEAATLAAKGNLNSDTRASIESQIALKANNVHTSVEQLKSSEQGTVAAASVENDLEAKLVGHERVLTGLSIDLPNEAPAIAPLLQKVRVQAEATNSKRKSTEQEVSVKTETTVRDAAKNQQKNAREKVRQLRALASTKRLQASTSAEATMSATEIEAAIDSGEQKLNEGRFGEALTTFQATIRAAKAVEVNLNAQDRLGNDVSSNSGRGSDNN